jgi:hypothetical protein
MKRMIRFVMNANARRVPILKSAKVPHLFGVISLQHVFSVPHIFPYYKYYNLSVLICCEDGILLVALRILNFVFSKSRFSLLR